MTEGLRGNLQDFGIAEVFQLIGQQRKTGVLEVSGPDDRVELHFDAGEVVAAAPKRPAGPDPLGEMLVRCGLITAERFESLEKERIATLESMAALLLENELVSTSEIHEVGDLLTRDTLFSLLRWTEGSFHFVAGALEDPTYGTRRHAEQILMDGLRMLDEWKAFGSRVPGEEDIFRRTGAVEALRDGSQLSSARLDAAERILPHVDGRSAVRRVVDLSRMGTFEGTRALFDLRRSGVIGLLDAKALARLRRRSQAGPRTPLGAWLGSILGIGSLLVVALGIQLQGPSGSSLGPGIRIWHAPLASMDAAFATRRLRNAAEAFRFASGRPPRSLEELVERGFVDADALATASGQPYYYVQRGESMLLLAPRH